MEVGRSVASVCHSTKRASTNSVCTNSVWDTCVVVWGEQWWGQRVKYCCGNAAVVRTCCSFAWTRWYCSRFAVMKWPYLFLAGGASSSQKTNDYSPSTGGFVGEGVARLNHLTLCSVIRHLLQADLTTSTQHTYAAGKKYLGFCQKFSVSPCMVTEQKLPNFAAFLSHQGLKYQMVNCYLLVVCHLKVNCGEGDPWEKSMSLFELALHWTRKKKSGIHQ